MTVLIEKRTEWSVYVRYAGWYWRPLEGHKVAYAVFCTSEQLLNVKPYAAVAETLILHSMTGYARGCR